MFVESENQGHCSRAVRGALNLQHEFLSWPDTGHASNFGNIWQIRHTAGRRQIIVGAAKACVLCRQLGPFIVKGLFVGILQQNVLGILAKHAEGHFLLGAWQEGVPLHDRSKNECTIKGDAKRLGMSLVRLAEVACHS